MCSGITSIPVPRQRKEEVVSGGRSDPGKELGSALAMPGAGGEPAERREARREQARGPVLCCPRGWWPAPNWARDGEGGRRGDWQDMTSGNKRAKRRQGVGRGGTRVGVRGQRGCPGALGNRTERPVGGLGSVMLPQAPLPEVLASAQTQAILGVLSEPSMNE